ACGTGRPARYFFRSGRAFTAGGSGEGQIARGARCGFAGRPAVSISNRERAGRLAERAAGETVAGKSPRSGAQTTGSICRKTTRGGGSMSAAATRTEGIAIVGMAGRFPKARNIDELWRNLSGGVEGISFFTDQELAA